jgi:hypothetical protein
MWLYFNDAFLSIVENHNDARMLHVRARHAGDIETLFPAATVHHTPHADYLYRADIERQAVADALAQRVIDIDYGNFKNSVDDSFRHDTYIDVWHASRRFQQASD